MYMIIGADFVPTNSNTVLFEKGEREALVDTKLLSFLDGAAYRIFNLEIPLTDKPDPIFKYGPNLMAPIRTIKGYQSIGANLLSLANNHIMDQGANGLRSTIKVLNDVGISYVGAGNNIKDAGKPFSFDFADKRIGVYACAEHEFSIASETEPGANPFDPLWALDHVLELKKHVDYVIVLYHGGKEHYRYPSPNLQKNCRRLVDKGADLVICQHSHCIGCEEKYRNGTIVYGQGNFLFDHSTIEYWQTSLLVAVNNQLNIEYIPLMKRDNSVSLATGEKGQTILKGFFDRSQEICTDGFVERQYAAFSKGLSEYYMFAISGNQSYFAKMVNKLTKNQFRRMHIARAYSNSSRARIVNYVRCETHRELLLRALENISE